MASQSNPYAVLSKNEVVVLQVLNCHDSVIYILAPLRLATVYGCSDATILLGAVGKVCCMPILNFQYHYDYHFSVYSM
ncbi:hypothetical protein ZIOFF_005709 [Zingiber officinale]|uniref:Tubulin binding cofactor C-like domain-containing protein n=1 Tax=Zingiber officinale TaxID=94328 RepID=A0A8J5ICZ1_ZINOF|nr:hypothetical protein ZIOFF_005709 [Zingiber officinale]